MKEALAISELSSKYNPIPIKFSRYTCHAYAYGL
jgi:hypothetical protein